MQPRGRGGIPMGGGKGGVQFNPKEYSFVGVLVGKYISFPESISQHTIKKRFVITSMI